MNKKLAYLSLFFIIAVFAYPEDFFEKRRLRSFDSRDIVGYWRAQEVIYFGKLWSKSKANGDALIYHFKEGGLGSVYLGDNEYKFEWTFDRGKDKGNIKVTLEPSYTDKAGGFYSNKFFPLNKISLGSAILNPVFEGNANSRSYNLAKEFLVDDKTSIILLVKSDRSGKSFSSPANITGVNRSLADNRPEGNPTGALGRNGLYTYDNIERYLSASIALVHSGTEQEFSSLVIEGSVEEQIDSLKGSSSQKRPKKRVERLKDDKEKPAVSEELPLGERRKALLGERKKEFEVINRIKSQ